MPDLSSETLSYKPEKSGSVRFLSPCGAVFYAEPLPELNKQVLCQKPDAVAALSPALRFQIVFHSDLSNRFRSRVEQGVDVDTFLRSSGWDLIFGGK